MDVEWIIGIVALLVSTALGLWFMTKRARLETDQSAQIEETDTQELVEQPVEPTAGKLAQRFFVGLARSREAMSSGIAKALGRGVVDEEALQALEDTLIGADLGVRTAMELTDVIRDTAKSSGGAADASELMDSLREQLRSRMGESAPLQVVSESPLVILVVGVNGSGKTTTIGKLAARYQRQGKKVMLAAGDTFRAGAIEQLKVWGDRADVPVVAQQEGSDPAAVIFDALEAGKARGMDVVICDTAGRLQAQKALMDELGKVVRVMKKAIPSAPHEVLLVLDATIGQNALSQAKVFKEVVGVTGVVLTKLDGTARGGVVCAVKAELGLPVKLVGLGEGIDDLRDFDPDAFVEALLVS